MAISNRLRDLLNWMNPAANKALLGTKIQTLQNGTGLDAAAIVNAALAVGAVEPDNLGLPVRNATGSAIAAGKLVYVSSYDATNARWLIALADADAAGRKATWVTQASISNNANGTVVREDTLTGQNTAGSTVGDPIYLSATAGGWTATKPTAAASIAQVVGRVTVVHASTGQVKFDLTHDDAMIGTNELQALAVTTAKIAAANVTAAELASNAVETAKIAAAAVTEPKLTLPTDNALNAKRVAKFLYDFTTLGGAIGAISLTGGALPANAVVVGGRLYVITPPTSGGAATAALSVEAANDLVNAAVISGAPWSTAGTKAIIPVNTAATDVVCTVARTPALTVGTATLTAGKLELWLEYLVHGT